MFFFHQVHRLQEILKDNRVRLDESEEGRRHAEQTRDEALLKWNTLQRKIHDLTSAESSSQSQLADLLHEAESDASVDVVKQQLSTIEDLKRKLDKKDTEIKRLRKRQRLDWDVAPANAESGTNSADVSLCVDDLDSSQIVKEGDDESGDSGGEHDSHDDRSDSEIEEEAKALESERRRKDREFRRANQRNARALRRLDNDIENKNVSSLTVAPLITFIDWSDTSAVVLGYD